MTLSSAEYAARHFGRFLPRKEPPTLQKLESFFFFAFLAALNSAVIDTVMGHVNVHIDRLVSAEL